jgi:TRAP transporter TAXI family solute receptor
MKRDPRFWGKGKVGVCLLVLGTVLALATGSWAQQTKLLFATGGVAGTFYPLGGAIAQVLNKSIPNLNITVQSSGGSVENARLLGTNGAELGLCMNDIAFYAQNSLEVFKAKNEKYTNFKAVVNIYPDVVQIFARRDGPIRSIADFKDKKVSVGPPGSGTEISARQVLGIYGLDFKTRKDFKPSYLSFAESADHFKDKRIDGGYFVVAVPNAAIQDINVMHPIRVLEIDDDAFQKIVKGYPLYARFVIPANSYQGIPNPVKTIAVYSALMVREDVPADLVYQMTKVILEQRAVIAQGHAAGKYIQPETATAGISVPFHPGAQKYLKEKGLLK